MLPTIWLDHNHVRIKLAEKLIKENQLQAYVVRSDESFDHFILDIKPAQVIVFLDGEDSHKKISSLVSLQKDINFKLKCWGREEHKELSRGNGEFFELPIDPFEALGLI